MPSKLPMIGLRLPPTLKAAAVKAAVADHRSLNNWLLALIEREVRSVAQTQRVKPLGRLDLIRLDNSANPTAPMGVYLEIDTRDGSLRFGYRHQCDNAVPFDVWHGIVRRLTVPTNADGEALTTAINNGEIDALIARIMAGSTVEWNGSNHVGNANEDAEAALDELRGWLDDQAGGLPDGTGMWDAGDWFSSCTAADLGIAASATDAELATIAEQLSAEARTMDVVIFDTYEHLERLRNNLRS